MADTVEVAAPSECGTTAVEMKPKNTHRLNRIFRKPKSSVRSRPWRTEEEMAGRRAGVSTALIRQMINELSDDEKQRAAANLDPLSATQEVLAKRAARFGIAVTPTAESFASAPPALVVDNETLKRREARFKTDKEVEIEEAMQRRLARFGGAATTAPMSAEQQAAMDARSLRFGS